MIVASCLFKVKDVLMSIQTTAYNFSVASECICLQLVHRDCPY